MSAAALPRIALAGNPNTGKTSLFNRLTGSSARVGNYAGVTVERTSGVWEMHPGVRVEVLDIPGTYSLAARSSEEQVAVRAVFGLDGEPRPELVVVVVDATQLVRNLYLAVQFIEAGIPVVVALNLIDVARSQGIEPDAARVASALGVPAVAISASTGEGMHELRHAVRDVLKDPLVGRARPGWRYPAALEADIARLVSLSTTSTPEEGRALALWTLLSVDDKDELLDVPAHVRAEVSAIRSRAQAAGRDVDAEIVGTRYRYLDGIDFGVRGEVGVTLTDRIDKVLLHPLWGGLSFVIVMSVLFWTLFRGAQPPMDLIQDTFAWLGDLIRATLPSGVVADFLVDAVLNGAGSVLVFLPQILLLFFLLGFLEDVGYMARVAYLVDRGMKSVGLHGRAFVPMLSGYACAVPAIMATRTLERRRDRILTMMVVPLMSCSARLPVYSLIIASLFADRPPLLGFLPADVVLMGCMYLFSTLTALLAASVLGRTLLRGPKVPLILELPPYRMPRLPAVLRQMWMRARMFVTEAGTVILACTAVLWVLLYFPRGPEPVIPDGASPEQVQQIEAAAASEAKLHSYGGQLGHFIEPTIRPLGFDWQIGVGLVGAFAAREVFVSTMGLVYSIGQDVDESDTRLWDRIRNDRQPDGSPTWTPLTGLSLMVFFALSAQCMSTLAVVRRESRSWRWPAFLFVYMTVLAWIVSFAVYQGGHLLGFE